MSTYTRKEFLGLSALLAGGAACAGLSRTRNPLSSWCSMTSAAVLLKENRPSHPRPR